MTGQGEWRAQAAGKGTSRAKSAASCPIGTRLTTGIAKFHAQTRKPIQTRTDAGRRPGDGSAAFSGVADGRIAGAGDGRPVLAGDGP